MSWASLAFSCRLRTATHIALSSSLSRAPSKASAVHA